MLLLGGLFFTTVALFVGALLALRRIARKLGAEQLANELPPELQAALAEPLALATPDAVAPAVIVGACPRCTTPLEDPRGAYDERRCPRTCGVLLALTGSERLFERAALDAEIVRAVVKEQGNKKGACASCGAAMHEGRLRGVVVDLCLSCGALWLDEGELEKIGNARVFRASDGAAS